MTVVATDANKGPTGRCPQCSQPADLSGANAFHPFCSERCKKLDFGAWLAERYAIEEPDDDPPAPEHQLQ